MVFTKTTVELKPGVLKQAIHLTHKRLIEQSKKGDRKAQFALYNQYVDAMFQISLRMLKHRIEAEDALQESFVKAFKNLNQFKYESSFGAWLKKIVINQCINQLKKKKIEWVSIEEESTNKVLNKQLSVSNDFTHDFDIANKLPQIETVKKAINQLPDGFRVVLSLYLLEGYDHREISEILNISESTSKTQYHRAKIKLKEIVKTK